MGNNFDKENKFDFWFLFLYNKTIIYCHKFMLNRQTTNNKTLDLLREVKLLRSALIGCIGKDAEGEYKPQFVKKILRDARENGKHVFKGKKLFLDSLK